jgi:hypothetical protein
MLPNIERLAFFWAVSTHFCDAPGAWALAVAELSNATGATASSPDRTKARNMNRTPNVICPKLFLDWAAVN